VVNGFLLPEDGQQHKKRIFVGTNWSAILLRTHTGTSPPPRRLVSI
jgi:hypothetical protein